MTFRREQSALAHYLAHRHSQAFSPSPLFDVDWYVARHAETLGRRRDPFMHFLQAGTQETSIPRRRSTLRHTGGSISAA